MAVRKLNDVFCIVCNLRAKCSLSNGKRIEHASNPPIGRETTENDKKRHKTTGTSTHKSYKLPSRELLVRGGTVGPNVGPMKVGPEYTRKSIPD
jgi:hypothetical protein